MHEEDDKDLVDDDVLWDMDDDERSKMPTSCMKREVKPGYSKSLTMRLKREMTR